MKKLIKVLLIEGNSDDALIIRKMLKEIEVTLFKVDHVKLLNDGLKHLSKDDFDIVLLDLDLSDSLWIESFNCIQNVASAVPIILLTGLSDKELAINALGEGAEDYLIKSYLDSILLDRSIHYAIEHKRLVEELEESEERYRIIVKNNRSGVFRINPYNELNYVNQHMAEMLGYKVNEMINRLIFDFMDRKGRKIFNDHMKKIRNISRDTQELQFINKEGSILRAVASTNTLFNSSNDYLGAVSIITDINYI